AMIAFLGTEATLYIDRGGYILTPEARKKVAAEELIVGTGPRGKDFYDQPNGELVHLTDWVEGGRSRRRPAAPAAAGVSGASAAHLANQALRGSGVAVWKG